MPKYVIGDIHGSFKGVEQIIKKTPLKKNDQLIFLGDYVDGWSENKEVIDYLIHLSSIYNCIFLKGNHDDLLLEYLKNNSKNNEWLKSGGQSSVNSYLNASPETILKHIDFLESLLPYHIDDKNRLFIHAGFTNLKGVKYEYFKPLFYWDRTLWETALSLDSSLPLEHPFYPERLKVYKEIFLGHTPVTRINKTTPFFAANVINLDTGAGFQGPLTIMNVDTKEYWQSNPSPELYPSEKGRNL